MKGYTTTGVFFRELFLLFTAGFQKGVMYDSNQRNAGGAYRRNDAPNLSGPKPIPVVPCSRRTKWDHCPRAQYGSIQLQEDDELKLSILWEVAEVKPKP